MKASIRTLVLTIACATAAQTATAQRPGHPYLTHDELPNSTRYLPAPPDTSDAAFFNDWLVYTRGLALRPTERGAQAKADAEYTPEYIARYYSPAAGFTISPDSTPELFHLVACVAWTGGDATWHAKNHYMRRRPFMVMRQGTMTPDHEAGLSRNGSYPSGHTAMGWSVALVLAEVLPEAQDSILTLGYAYGQSRTIVGAHWQSDVDAGRVVGAAAVARMHASADFQSDLAAAKAEVARLRGGKVSKPNVGKNKRRMR